MTTAGLNRGLPSPLPTALLVAAAVLVVAGACVSLLQSYPPAAGGVPAAAHRLAAERHAQGDASLQALQREACAPDHAPTAARALQQLRDAEAAHQAERVRPRPRPEALLQAVVRRGCAAYHATRLQRGAAYPVWWHTQVHITSVRPAAGGFEVQARATTLEGAVAGSRVTFARGLHHACFVPTGASGHAGCVLQDSHPHGDRLNGWAEAHEGPFVATVAGSASPTRVELPAVALRDVPVFAVALPLR